MLFTSISFLYYFLPIVLILYFTLPKKCRNVVLFFASLFFYYYGEPKYIILMLAEILVAYIGGLLINKYKKKSIMVVTVGIHIALLCIFKYTDFIISNVNSVTGANIQILRLALPIGISFYTFQILSYVIDVYKGKVNVQKNPIRLATYVMLFPQLIAGPIVRYETVAEQINYRKENFDDFSKGVYRFIFGLSKKVLISNQMAIIADVAFDNSPSSVLFAWLGAIAYALQIYFDFSGYSDMAIGLGAMFGFKFDENFNYPYIAKSITDFWHRWHISLSTWFRDYVYIPLGGSRCKRSRAFLNIFIVWLLTGIWHGASWNFILWGLYFFVFLIIEKSLFKDKLKKLDEFSWWKKTLLHVYTLVIVLFSWVLFRTTSLSGAFEYLKDMLGLGQIPIIDSNFTRYIGDKFIYLLAGIIFSMPIHKYILRFVDKNKVISCILSPIFMITLFLISTAFLVKGTYNPFIYFNF